MIIYDGLKTDFMKSVENETLADEIEAEIFEKMGRHTQKNEFMSWVNSMSRMYMVIKDDEIPNDAGIAIEYNIPQTAKRVDFIISGYNEKSTPEMVIVELKQWEKLSKVEKSDSLVETYTGGANRMVVQYVSKNTAPREVYAAKLKGNIRKSSVDNMFKGSGCYTDTENNLIQTLLVDEAHRLNEKSGIFHNKGVNQIEEIIHSAICSVFFIDESQRATMSDIGSVDEIRRWSEAEGSEVTEMQLVSQFRCNGSDGYIAFIDDLLQIRDTANFTMDSPDYDIRVFDTPEEVRQLIIEKNKLANRARILAGYCWEWPTSERKNTNYHDIQIGDFGISWNLQNGQAFAISPDSVNEAGCIHTTQGLEFDYVGVIIGDDMRYESGKVITDFTRRASTISQLRDLKSLRKVHLKRLRFVRMKS